MTEGRRVGAQKGLTLLEVLVTLMIVAMVSLLVSDGLFQATRIEQRLQDRQLQGQLSALHELWLRRAIEGLLPAAKESGESFQGDELGFQGLSSMAPSAAAAGPGWFRLALAKSGAGSAFPNSAPEAGLPGSGLVEVWLTVQSAGKRSSLLDEQALATGARELKLLSWLGGNARWRYQDDLGAWHERWPIDGARAQLLPRLVMLEDSRTSVPLILAAPINNAEPLGKRADLEAQP
ncbi:prepilin-type N-terminal cleavage/methylation domain-containing protein [Paucibacter sp. DJ1R-11]|uniref:prepilin-type N-terminal cleavage/methylation domain-containing protein n=1 Tax=Paucibacter sp. DJ1R-11 TaxID=2893556 RepID=UPI0021E3A703|nr:prepilin-type N-terminal cleavage/methylation domain-containing protein [Paucibacter sp. DJ1R-11]MCV2364682.1 prepilin-type N-terminal cleavage/methylation domain-containing protein [Paucibacter sp. DJ1R-11]